MHLPVTRMNGQSLIESVCELLISFITVSSIAPIVWPKIWYDTKQLQMIENLAYLRTSAQLSSAQLILSYDQSR